MHCCNINKSRRGDFFLVHLVYRDLTVENIDKNVAKQQSLKTKKTVHKFTSDQYFAAVTKSILWHIHRDGPI